MRGDAVEREETVCDRARYCVESPVERREEGEPRERGGRWSREGREGTSSRGAG